MQPATPAPGRDRAAALAVAGAVALVAVISLLPALLGRVSIVESDVLDSYAPWRDTSQRISAKGVTPAHDTIDGSLPARAEFASRLRDGDVPLWDPYGGGGSPLGAVPNVGSWSPLNLPYLAMPVWLAAAYSRLLTSVAAVGFSFLFLRRLGLGRPAAVLGGLVYATSGFVVLWNNWPHSQVAAMIPALFWSTERLLQRRRWSSAVPLALALAVMSIEGFPAVVGYAGLALVGYVAARLLLSPMSWRDRAASAIRWGAGCLCGLGVAAFQLLPFAHQLSQLDLGYRQHSPDDHAPLGALLTTAFPWAFGSEVNGDFFGYANTIESIAFVGAAAMLLVAHAVVFRRVVTLPAGAFGALVGSVVVCVILGWIGGPFLAAAQQFFLFGGNAIGRIRSVLCFALAMLAAVGFQALTEQGTRLRAVRSKTVIVAWSLCAGFAVLVAADAFQVIRAHDGLREAVAASLLDAVCLLIAAALLVRLHDRSRRTDRLAVVTIPVLVAVQAIGFLATAWPHTSPGTPYPMTGTHAFLTENLGHDRFASPNGVMFPSSNVAYGLRSVTSHAFQFPSWYDMLATADPEAPHPPTLTMLTPSHSAAASPVLDRLGAKYWVADPADGVLGAPTEAAASPRGTVVVDRGTSVRADVPSGPKRGIELRPVRPLVPSGPTARLAVEVLDSSGRVLASGAYSFSRALPARPLVVPLAAETGPAAAATQLRVVSENVRAVLAGAGGTSAYASPLSPANDGLRLVHAGDALVYERLNALPRIRWASRAEVAASRAERLERLRRGVGPESVLLNEGPGGGDGKPADVAIVEDSGDAIRARVRAGGAGWLVVADALQHGWSARIGSRDTPLLPADHGLVAVAVPPGEHLVQLRYDAPGLRTGLAVSGGSVLLLAATAWLSLARRSRNGTPARSTVGTDEGDIVARWRRVPAHSVHEP